MCATLYLLLLAVRHPAERRGSLPCSPLPSPRRRPLLAFFSFVFRACFPAAVSARLQSLPDADALAEIADEHDLAAASEEGGHSQPGRRPSLSIAQNTDDDDEPSPPVAAYPSLNIPPPAPVQLPVAEAANSSWSVHRLLRDISPWHVLSLLFFALLVFDFVKPVSDPRVHEVVQEVHELAHHVRQLKVDNAMLKADLAMRDHEEQRVQQQKARADDMQAEWALVEAALEEGFSKARVGLGRLVTEGTKAAHSAYSKLGEWIASIYPPEEHSQQRRLAQHAFADF